MGSSSCRCSSSWRVREPVGRACPGCSAGLGGRIAGGAARGYGVFVNGRLAVRIGILAARFARRGAAPKRGLTIWPLTRIDFVRPGGLKFLSADIAIHCIKLIQADCVHLIGMLLEAALLEAHHGPRLILGVYLRSAEPVAHTFLVHEMWNVPSHMAPLGNPSRVSMRLRISAAALLVKVTARMLLGDAPSTWISQATRCTNTRVLPLPAPANTMAAPSGEATACR
jgi:hypothetical protein